MGTLGHRRSLTVTSLGSGDMDVRTVTQPLGTGERFTRLGPRDRARLRARHHRSLLRRRPGLVRAGDDLEQLDPDRDLRLRHAVPGLGRRPAHRREPVELRHPGPATTAATSRFLYDNDPDQSTATTARSRASASPTPFAVPVLFRVGLAYPRAASSASDACMVAADAFHPSDNAREHEPGRRVHVHRTSSRCAPDTRTCSSRTPRSGSPRAAAARGSVDELHVSHRLRLGRPRPARRHASLQPGICLLDMARRNSP